MTSTPTSAAPPLLKGGGKGSTAMLRKIRKVALPYGYLTPTVVLLTILMIIPIVMVVGYSMMNNVIMIKNPVFVGFQHYVEILTSDAFRNALQNTLFFDIVSVVVHLLLGFGFAMMLNSPMLGKVTKSIFRTIYVLPWLFTVAIIAVLWRLLLEPTGVINYLLMTFHLTTTQIEWLSNPDIALYAVTFINIWSGYPFYMTSLLAGLQGIPKDYYEAAEVDGASGWQKLIYITLPQLRPIIIAMALLDFIWTTQQFALIWMTTGGGPLGTTEMLSTYTYKFAFSTYQFGSAAASAVIILVISMVLTYLYVRAQKVKY
ncbi:MAG: sugar ABC transporter permease [Propionibacteriaceae bacterium]